MTDESLIEELALQDYLRVQERKRVAELEKEVKTLNRKTEFLLFFCLILLCL